MNALRNTATALAILAAIAPVQALQIEPTRIKLWSIILYVSSPGVPTQRMAAQATTRERCEDLRATVQQSFSMMTPPLCLPEMVSPEEFKEVLKHERKAFERHERGT